MPRVKGEVKAKPSLPVKHFEIGEEVMGKWPNGVLWYEASVLSINYEENRCLLKFCDGQENDLPFASVMHKKNFRSRSSSPSRRSRSPGRRRSRSKSPSRAKKAPSPRKKSISPGRKTPKRGATLSKAAAKQTQSEAKNVEQEVDEKPPMVVPKEGTVTVTTRTKIQRTPPRSAVGQQLEARMTRSTLRQLEQHGADVGKLRQELGKGLGEEKPGSRVRGYEFGGTLGVVFLTYALPLFVLATYLYCNGKKCHHLAQIYKQPYIKLPALKKFFDPEAAALLYGWIAFHAFLSILPLGKVVDGMQLKDKTRLRYRLNGFWALMISLVAFAACVYYKVPVVQFVYSKFLALITHSIIFVFVGSVLLFLKALREGTGLAEYGSSGNPIYDFFMGRQLNPRLCSFDLKFFFELRPGLIGLLIIDLVMAVKLYEKTQEVNIAMLLICLFHFIYIADGLWFEESDLTMHDITTEGFGFMLLFGDVVWVPFIWSLQARFLVDHSYKIAPWMVALILILNGIGFIIFRVANLQKDLFRQNPQHPAVQHLDSMPTGVHGKHLLVSGWWGYVRHPNYLGEIFMAVAWSLTCGFTHVLPYVYPMTVIVILVHRCYRDDTSCRLKYGRSWDEYCKRVPYRLFPNIF